AFRAALAAAGLRHKRTRPYTPRTNGKAERFIQTSLREWAYARPYATSRERHAALAPWLDHYNTERPHAALAHHPPAARLLQSQLLSSIEGAVASSRPNSNQDCSGGPGQGSPKATGVSRRAASRVSDISDSLGRQDPCGTPSVPMKVRQTRLGIFSR